MNWWYRGKLWEPDIGESRCLGVTRWVLGQEHTLTAMHTHMCAHMKHAHMKKHAHAHAHTHMHTCTHTQKCMHASTCTSFRAAACASAMGFANFSALQATLTPTCPASNCCVYKSRTGVSFITSRACEEKQQLALLQWSIL